MDILDSLVDQQAQIADLSRLKDRYIGLELGIVRDRDDPQQLGRIKVTTGSTGNTALSDWLFRCVPGPDVFMPVPRIGQTVVVGYLAGNTHQGVYLGTLANQANPHTGVDNLTIKVGPVEVVITSDGTVSLLSFDELRLSGNAIVIDSDRLAIESPSVTIAGEEVAVVGAKDDSNDKLIDSGR